MSLANRRAGWAFLLLVLIAFSAVSLPVIVNGAPLLDDYANCLELQEKGIGPAFRDSFERLGVVRPAHYLEVAVTGALCPRMHFGVLILIPWVLTIGVAFALRGLLQDVNVKSPWPEIGAGLWLLQPLGTESALWPAAMHISLGLLLALLSLRSYQRGRLVAPTLYALGACLSVEQSIFVLPLAAWLVSPVGRKTRALVVSGATSALVLAAYSIWPGRSFYTNVGLADRIKNIFTDIDFYVVMPGIALGGHSIPVAIKWLLPFSILGLALAAAAGFMLGRRLLKTTGDGERFRIKSLIPIVALLGLINLPIAISYHPHSPRLFTPSILMLAFYAAIFGSRVRWERPHLIGSLAGLVMAGALLSLSLSAFVRVRSSDITEPPLDSIASRLQDGEVVAICGVEKSVVEPIPSGDFTLHELIAFTDDAILFRSGKRVEVRRGGPYQGNHCPDLDGVDLQVEFKDLIRRPGESD